jgi:HSP20 family protein
LTNNIRQPLSGWQVILSIKLFSKMTQVKFQTIPFGGILNQLAQNALQEISNHVEPVTRPAMNVLESETGFELQIAAPGFQKNEFSINIEGEKLTISAKKEVKTTAPSDKWLRREFGTTEFSRVFKMPESVDANQIDATFEQGILTLQLVKKESSKPVVKSIQVI